MSLTLLTACSRSERGVTIGGTTFYFTVGLDEAAVMKNGDFALTKAQVLLLLDSVRNGYADILTADIWDKEIDGTTFEEYVENSVMDMSARLLLVNMLAFQNGISLTSQELENVNEAAERFIEDNSGQLDYINSSEVKELFAMMSLSDKVYEELTQNVNTEISVDEARIIKIQYIYSKESIKKLQNALDDIGNGYEFVTVAAKYSECEEYTAELGRGETVSEFENAAFNLDEGQISDIIACDNGYYLIKCINDNVEDKAESQREKIIQERKERQFQSFLSSFAKGTSLYFDEKAWDEVCRESREK